MDRDHAFRPQWPRSRCSLERARPARRPPGSRPASGFGHRGKRGRGRGAATCHAACCHPLRLNIRAAIRPFLDDSSHARFLPASRGPLRASHSGPYVTAPPGARGFGAPDGRSASPLGLGPRPGGLARWSGCRRFGPFRPSPRLPAPPRSPLRGVVSLRGVGGAAGLGGSGQSAVDRRGVRVAPRTPHAGKAVIRPADAPLHADGPATRGRSRSRFASLSPVG